jgi:hypothetical protein
MSVTNLAIKRGKKKKKKKNDIILLALNGQISYRNGWNDHYENGIKLGGSK